MRLDKWLWCARFFRTRQVSASAIRTGKVRVNGGKAKPSRTVAAGDRLLIDKQGNAIEVDILVLSPRRLSAPLAAAMYRETAHSIKHREQLRAVRQLDRLSRVRMERRKPGKRERRALENLKRGMT